VTLTGVTHRYRRDNGTEVAALERIDLDVEPGAFLSIVGPSGCGKSTLLRLVAGFLHPSDGAVRVGERLVEGPGPDRGVVFQQPNLYPWLTVQGNVEFGPRMQRVPREERRRRAAELLSLVGLSDSSQLRPYELSGGMQQRCQIARVLATEPAVLLMDEPFGALDALTRARLQDELIELWHRSGTTVFFITHSVDEAVYLGSRVLVMSPRPGRIVDDVAAPFSTERAGPAVRDSAAFLALRRRVAEGITSAEDPSPTG
jgi:ABC-type nitrate/sulfonate/bicarbonate transport system ATPase subunit